jgi:chromosomal replication initiation ATPase DnaA
LPQSSTGLADFRECTAHRDERVVAMDMLYRHGQLSQALIGKIMGGLDYTTVSRERKRLRQSAQQDKRFGAVMGEIE